MQILKLIVGMVLVSSSPLFAKEYLIICSGQSNMGGVAPIALMPEEMKAIPANVVFFKNPDLAKPLAPITTFADGPKFGPTPSFAHALADARPKDKFVILVDAVGGSMLMEWVPDYGPKELTTRVNKGGATIKMPVGNLYEPLPKRLEQIRQKYPEAEPFAFIWIQGESDQAPWAGAYLENFKRLVANIRGITSPNLLVITSDPGKADPLVYEAFAQFAKDDKNSAHVPSRDLNPGNGLHYSPTAYIEIGKRLAATLVAHLPASQ